MSTTPGHVPPHAAGFSAAPEPESRATFGWRPGSIRGLLSLIVLGLLWSVALFAPELKEGKLPQSYIYLQYLLVLIIAYYFPPYGSVTRTTRGDRRLIRLWPEVVPWILVAGSIGLAVWVFHYNREFPLPSQAFYVVPLAVLTGFFVGHAITWVVSRVAGGRLPAGFQDLQAWVALVGMIALTAELLFNLFVVEGLDAGQRDAVQRALTQWEGLLAGLVAFYYGARSESPRVSS